MVVLNKVDLLPEEGRSKIINKAKKRLSQTLNATKFAGCTMIPTTVKSGTAETTCHCSCGTSRDVSILRTY